MSSAMRKIKKNPAIETMLATQLKPEPKKKLKTLEVIRNGFLKLVRGVLQITSVILVVYLTAMILIPTIAGELGSYVGLTGATHFYNMLSNWGLPMLCITLAVTYGDICLCKYIIKVIKNTFQSRIDAGLETIKK